MNILSLLLVLDPWEQELINLWIQTLYNIVSMLMIFFMFGLSIYLMAMQKADKDYLLKKKLKRILRKKGIIDLEEGFNCE